VDTESPAVSVVVVVGDRRERAAAALTSILRQEGIDRAEVLLIDLGAEALPPLAGSSHPSVRMERLGGIRPYGQVRAEAVRRARGRSVFFMEEHCLAHPGWLRSLLERLAEGPWAAVGPRVVSGNPGVGLSDAMGMINYGKWTGSQAARESDMLPGNNSAYRRKDLLDLGPQLESLMLADTVLQWRLMDEGGRLFVEPGAVVSHRYPTTLWSASKGEFLYHVGFAGARAESFDWPWPLRLVYAAASPVIPLARLFRMSRSQPELVRRNLAGVVVLLYAAVFGQALGAMLGSRAVELRFTDYELNEPRPVRGERSPG
jgi:hypothetical protein